MRILGVIIIFFGVGVTFVNGQLCPRLTLENGRVRMRSRNTVAKFKCRRNFMMIEGDRFMTCRLGVWRGTMPKCIGSGCGNQFTFPNGIYMLMFGDALAKFHCDRGYQLTGSGALYCNGRRWNDTTPECREQQQSPYECNFEENSCMWTMESMDEAALHFERVFSDTMHRNSSGYFIELQSTPLALPGTFARMYSPVLQPFIMSPSCATFWVLMQEHTTAQVLVFLKPESEDLDILVPETMVITFTGHDWRLVYVSLQDMDEPFQVVIEVSHGDAYTSEVRIDDFLATHSDQCLMLEMAFIKQEMMDAVNRNETYGTPPPDVVPITIPIPEDPSTVTLLKPSSTFSTSTLPERVTFIPSTNTSTTTTTTIGITTSSNITTLAISVTTSSTPSSNQTSSTTSKPETTTPTSTSTTTVTPVTSLQPSTSSTVRSSTTKNTTPKTTTPKQKFTTTSTTKRPSTKQTTPTTRQTKRTSTTSPTTSSTTTNVPLTASSKSKDSGGKLHRAFSSLLTALLVSLGVVLFVIIFVFTYKKYNEFRQGRLSDDSDVKYLQHGGDNDSIDAGVDDSHSLIYHPKRSLLQSSMMHSSSLSSASTSIASSIGSTSTGASSDCSSKRPVRPPPPAFSVTQEGICDVDDDEDLITVEDVIVHTNEQHSLLLPSETMKENTGSVLVPDTGSLPRMSSIESTSIDRPSGRDPPPPIPPRNFGTTTSV